LSPQPPAPPATLVTERISLDGIPLELVDTAGLEDASPWKRPSRLGVARSREALADAALVLIVLDATQPLNDEEHRLLGRRRRPSRAGRHQQNATCLKFIRSPEASPLPASRPPPSPAKASPPCANAFWPLATGGAASEPGLLTSLRHHQAISTTLAALADAAQANADSIPHEMILLDLYRALWALDSLTGQTTPDDILNLIFSTFCIGK
jgi:tRNA modification GTPase